MIKNGKKVEGFVEKKGVVWLPETAGVWDTKTYRKYWDWWLTKVSDGICVPHIPQELLSV